LSKDSKRLLKYLGLIFISALLTYKLPRDTYSIIQYLIKPIRFENSVLFLSGLFPLILLIVGIKGLLKMARVLFSQADNCYRWIATLTRR